MRTVGLQDRLGNLPSQLSGGQQQRVAVARALVPKPDIIFADEPTGALDSRTGIEILTFMRRAVDDTGQTIVMVTHDPHAASYANRVLFLADGQIVDSMDAPDLGPGAGPDEAVRGLRAAMFKLVLSSVRHNLGRYLATLVAIIAGVGFYTAVSVISDGVISSLEGNVDDQYGNVDVAVVPDETARRRPSTGAEPEPLKVPQSTVDQLLALPGVDGGAGILTAPVAFPAKDGKPFATSATGRLWITDDELNPLVGHRGRGAGRDRRGRRRPGAGGGRGAGGRRLPHPADAGRQAEGRRWSASPSSATPTRSTAAAPSRSATPTPSTG